MEFAVSMPRVKPRHARSAAFMPLQRNSFNTGRNGSVRFAPPTQMKEHGRDRFHTVPVFPWCRTTSARATWKHECIRHTLKRLLILNVARKVWDADGTRPYHAMGHVARSSHDYIYLPWQQKRNLPSWISTAGQLHLCDYTCSLPARTGVMLDRKVRSNTC